MKTAIVAALVATLAASCDAGSKPAELPQQTAQPSIEVNTPQQVDLPPLNKPAVLEPAPAVTPLPTATVPTRSGPERVREPATPTTPTGNEGGDETAPAAHDMHEHSTKSDTSNGATFARVEPSKVCMVNNHYMGREQIPVVVQGKTYFGCCEMCKGKLAKDPSSRAAKDPVSGKTVDKAVAVIGSDPSGTVQYFENAKNFETYASR
jgi:YHS domain-containing protein